MYSTIVKHLLHVCTVYCICCNVACHHHHLSLHLQCTTSHLRCQGAVARSSGRSEAEILKDTNTKKNAQVHAFHILDIGMVIIFSVPNTELVAARDGDGCWWRLLTFICHEFQHKTQSDTATLPLCTATRATAATQTAAQALF